MSKTACDNQPPKDPRLETETETPKRKIALIVVALIAIILTAFVVIPNALLAAQSHLNAEIEDAASEVSQMFEELDEASGDRK